MSLMDCSVTFFFEGKGGNRPWGQHPVWILTGWAKVMEEHKAASISAGIYMTLILK